MRGVLPAAVASAAAVVAVLVPPLAFGSVSGCARPLRMCTAAGDCTGDYACVAGRCVSRGAQPAIATARREVFAPVAVGYVESGAASPGDPSERGVTPAVGTLSRGGRVFLRFSVPLAPETGVVEAYVLIDRVPSAAGDASAPVALHLAEAADAWDPRSLTWAAQPRVRELNAPVTNVVPAGGPVLRLDARTLVDRWRERRGADELGVALVAAGPGDVAIALAPLEPVGHERFEGAADVVDAAADAPRLELYVR
ncbi:MAG TPA: hypothetical protein VHV30_04075 [Polyangiaceae bacterium]|nr:hypothetical protein [Polyangiaceae bacterium]